MGLITGHTHNGDDMIMTFSIFFIITTIITLMLTLLIEMLDWLGAKLVFKSESHFNILILFQSTITLSSII